MYIASSNLILLPTFFLLHMLHFLWYLCLNSSPIFLIRTPNSLLQRWYLWYYLGWTFYLMHIVYNIMWKNTFTFTWIRSPLSTTNCNPGHINQTNVNYISQIYTLNLTKLIIIFTTNKRKSNNTYITCMRLSYRLNKHRIISKASNLSTKQ